MSQAKHNSEPHEPAAQSRPRGTGLTAQISPWLGALLGEVISQTDQLIESDQAGTGAVPELLRLVAEKHRGQELCVDPVMTELVEAVISDLAARINHEELRKRLVRHVAETLHDDPEAFKRISSLWANLQRSLT